VFVTPLRTVHATFIAHGSSISKRYWSAQQLLHSYYDECLYCLYDTSLQGFNATHHNIPAYILPCCLFAQRCTMTYHTVYGWHTICHTSCFSSLINLHKFLVTEKPIWKSAPFRARQILNRYHCHYNKAFAFSSLLYLLRRRVILRFSYSLFFSFNFETSLGLPCSV